jgi:membrane complex biogenesis BtpA family protein
MAAARDAKALFAAGFDLAIIENFGDAPFLAGRVAAVTVSAMTACALAVRDAAPDLPVGVNVLRNDADAALAIALVVSASCVRVNVHTGARVTDQGVIQGDAAATLRTRRALGADRVEIWADVDVKHSAPLAARPIDREAADLVGRGLASAVLVTGEGTGLAVDPSRLGLVRSAVEVPVLVASGATEEQLPALAPLCDGVVVGSALRTDRRAGGPIDEGRARAFAAAFRRAFAEG